MHMQKSAIIMKLKIDSLPINEVAVHFYFQMGRTHSNIYYSFDGRTFLRIAQVNPDNEAYEGTIPKMEPKTCHLSFRGNCGVSRYAVSVEGGLTFEPDSRRAETGVRRYDFLNADPRELPERADTGRDLSADKFALI